MMNLLRQSAVKVGVLLSMAAIALSNSSLTYADDKQHLLDGVKKFNPNLKIGKIKPTSIKGLYQAELDGGRVITVSEDGKYFFTSRLTPVKKSPVNGMQYVGVMGGSSYYVSSDGKYFIEGDMYEVADEGIANATEKTVAEQRKSMLDGLNVKDMVVFSPEQKAKSYVYIFTDVDCGWCRRQHQEVAKINEKGIEVRYLAFPRAGINSPSYRKIASAWCNENPNDSLTKVKAGKNIPENVCKGNPIPEQYMLGRQIGVNGTPAIVTADGRIMPGYADADKLAGALGL